MSGAAQEAADSRAEAADSRTEPVDSRDEAGNLHAEAADLRNGTESGILGEIVRYLIVGGLTTVVSLGVYYGCVLTFLNPDKALELQAANILSWIAAVTFAFFANKFFVFRSGNAHVLKEAGAFFTARIGTLLMDMAIMFIGVTVLGYSDKIMKLLVQVVVTIANYVFSKVFVFRK